MQSIVQAWPIFIHNVSFNKEDVRMVRRKPAGRSEDAVTPACFLAWSHGIVHPHFLEDIVNSCR
jgi:hypothetical protein